jgi:transposase
VHFLELYCHFVLCLQQGLLLLTRSEIFYKYLDQFSKYKPEELKIIVIDKAGFHSMKNYELPKNIRLVRIPPYTPELNPPEKIWAYIKPFYK